MRTAIAIALILVTSAHAQQQGAPVYKCVMDGKTAYSNTPCKGGVEVDVTPTRGADKMSGTSRKSAQAEREDLQEKINEVLGRPPVRKLSISKP